MQHNTEKQIYKPHFESTMSENQCESGSRAIHILNLDIREE